jgi:hypothetical protein
MYYKHITIVSDDSSTVNEFETSLTDDARVVIYYRHMFIVEAIGPRPIEHFSLLSTAIDKGLIKASRISIGNDILRIVNL